MILAWRGLRQEDVAPYRHARMVLVDWICFFAEAERQHPCATEVQHARAKRVAEILSDLYPKIRDKMRQPGRVERICAAIEAATRSSAGRVPWKQILEAWDGIEMPISAESWRQDWVRWKRNRS
jgi:hypothetical protein